MEIAFRSIENFNKLEKRKFSSSVQRIDLEHKIQMKNLAVERKTFVARTKMAEKLSNKKLFQERKENDKEFPQQLLSLYQELKPTLELTTVSNGKKNIQLAHHYLPKIRQHMSKPTTPKIKIIPPIDVNKRVVQSEPKNAKQQTEAKYDIQNVLYHEVTRTQTDLTTPHRRGHTSTGRKVSFHPMSVPKHTITASAKDMITRRISCPNLGLAKTRILAGGIFQKRRSLEPEEVSKIRECRYLRVPEAIDN